MRVVPFDDERAQRAALPDVVAHLRSGGLLLYPTETVFGLGGLTDIGATRALAELKSRDAAKPFILLIDRRELSVGLEWTDDALLLADAFWPGPLTLVLRDDAARYARGIRSEGGGVAVRETPHAGVRLLLDALGEPVTSTSANSPGAPPARTQEEARALMSELSGRADVWLLDGPAGGAEPSTVVDCTGRRPRIVRAGAVSAERIREIVRDVEA